MRRPSLVHDLLSVMRFFDYTPIPYSLLTTLYSLSLGFVPTMGSLHDGHLSLIRQSLQENDRTIVSIYVNPTQFNDAKDFEHYPRDIARDQSIIESMGAEIFLPSDLDVYPSGVRSAWELPERITSVLCGPYRPGHFEGVCTVVERLFDMVQPSRAYFGLKDYQQCKVIDYLVRERGFQIDLSFLPTVREENGLALSSRNMLLSDAQKKSAAILYRALQSGHDLSAIRAAIEGAGITVEYVEMVDANTLEPCNFDRRVLIAVAAHVGDVRLIDSVVLDAVDSTHETS